MRSVLGYFSLFSFAVLAAGVIVVVGSGSGSVTGTSAASGGGLHAGSLLIGLAAGLLLSAMLRVSWAQIPGRTVAWLTRHERNLVRFVWVVLFALILCFY
jgi:hypothetical protein